MKEISANRLEKKGQCPIIGIGASEGSLAPLQAIIDGLPVTFNAPVVFVRHFSSDSEKSGEKSSSVKSSARPIIEIANAMPLENGKVYVNPPGHDVTIKAGLFHLKRCFKEKAHFPIDIFFTSLAEEAQDAAIAVVLSGTGADGVRGIREVQCKGGAVLVQDPVTAEFAAMPRSAIEAGNIDEVLTPENIARRIVSRSTIIQLERELFSTRYELQTNVEELRIANEDLQSLNEELVTLNAQLQEKIEEQEATNNDLNNFISSANIPTLFLDRAFNIRRFTPAMTRLINLIPQDVGRPIGDMKIERLGIDLLTDAQTVLDKLSPVSREVAIDKAWYVRSMLFYSTSDNRIEGVVVTFIDITSRKKDEEALRESEQRFRLTLKNAPVSVAAQDKDLRFLWAYNQRTVDPADVPGKTDSDIFAPEDAQKLMALKRKVMETGQETREQLWLTSNGKRVFIDLYIEPLRSESGEVTGVGLATVDLTQMKFAEEALKESEERFRVIAETTPMGIGVVSIPDGKYLYVNADYEQKYGYSQGELIGKTTPDIYYDIADRDRILAILKEQGTVLNDEVRFKRKDGTIFLGVSSIRPIVYGGTKALLGVCVDITERKQAEESIRAIKEQLSAVFDGVSETLMLLDLEGTIIVANKLAIQRLNQGKTDFIGKKMSDLIPVHFHAQRKEQISKMVRTKAPVKFQNTFGDTILDLTFYPVFDAQGNVVQFVSFALDITERRRAEDALRESEERFRIIAETVPVLVCVTRSADSVVLFTNEYNNKAFGLRREDIIGSKGPDYYCDPADRIKMIEIFKEQGIVDGYPLKVKKADGTPFWILTSIRSITYSGQPAIIGASIDITDLKRAEDALRVSNEELARFNRVAVDRELRMIALKKEINALREQTGQAPLYLLDFKKEKT